MNLGLSLLTNEIYAGKSVDCGKGLKKWVGKKHNVTDEAIKAVFQYMYCKAEETGHYEISVDGFGAMVFAREDNPSEEARK